MSDLVPLEEGEASLWIERPPRVRSKVVVVLLVVLMGPGLVGSLVAAPIAGWLTKSWWVALAFVAGAAGVGVLGWLMAKLSTAMIEARSVNVQLTTKRCVVERRGGVEQLAWSEIAAVRALRQPGIDGAGEVTWLDVAGLVVDLAVDSAAERKSPTTAAYWSGAAGMVLRGKDGRVLEVPCAKATGLGPELVRALVEKRTPVFSAAFEVR